MRLETAPNETGLMPVSRRTCPTAVYKQLLVLIYTLRWVILRLFSQHKCVAIRRSQISLTQELLSVSCSFVIHLLITRLILPFMGYFGDCLNHRFSLIRRITRISGSSIRISYGISIAFTIRSVGRSLSSRLRDLYRLHYPVSWSFCWVKLSLFSRQLWILIRLPRRQQVAIRRWNLYGRTEAITI